MRNALKIYLNLFHFTQMNCAGGRILSRVGEGWVVLCQDMAKVQPCKCLRGGPRLAPLGRLQRVRNKLDCASLLYFIFIFLFSLSLSVSIASLFLLIHNSTIWRLSSQKEKNSNFFAHRLLIVQTLL